MACLGLTLDVMILEVTTRDNHTGPVLGPARCDLRCVAPSRTFKVYLDK